MSVYDKIRIMRIFKGYTQEYMAEQLGYSSVNSYSKLERGEVEITLGKLEEISFVFGISLDVLLGLNEHNVLHVAYGQAGRQIKVISESHCAHELEKVELLLVEREKEIEQLKEQIILLKELVSLLKTERNASEHS